MGRSVSFVHYFLEIWKVVWRNPFVGSPQKDPLRAWSFRDAVEMYNIPRWSEGYFDVNEKGNVTATAGGDGSSVDLKVLVDELQDRGIELPVLLRFSEILRAEIARLNHAFANAISEYSYNGAYRGVYPIKVNQNRKVVEEIVKHGRPFHHGLEAGSKPELLATVALHNDPEALIVCNGYKDKDYVRTALWSTLLGKKTIIVVEKLSELETILQVSDELGVEPMLGVRAKLSTRGAGKWEQSGGERSKFGLTAAEILDMIHLLRHKGKLGTLRLLHFHLGSQIASIRSIKNAIREAGHFFVEMHRLGCSRLDYFDVGGGLGVDYDGSQSSFASSRNYTIQAYANDVVFGIQQVCDKAEIKHPTIVSESGRAIVAHHCVLIVDVLGVNEAGKYATPLQLPNGDDSHEIVENFLATLANVSSKNLSESYHDALSFREQALQLFNLGHLSLENRVLCFRLFWSVIEKVRNVAQNMSHVPEDIQQLRHAVSDTFFCNFSMFQSLPDVWAIDQLFPIVPIHRLGERPTKTGILADITCDSDGKIDEFIDPHNVKKQLELHAPNQEPYFLGVFLVGAYQEILGDLHNLFGDTHTVHVTGIDGGYHVEDVVQGDTVEEVLRYVDYSPEDLMRQLRSQVEQGIRSGHLTPAESRKLMGHFKEGMASYTYLQG